MSQSSVRSATANSGKTVLALVAILSLLLSLFAIARPAIATHAAFEPVETSGPGADPNECEGFDFGYKIDVSDLIAGTHTYNSTDGLFTVTLVYDPTAKSVSFSGASPAVSRFVVKGGSEGPFDGRTITDYPTPVTSGGPSSPPGGAGVSHVTFCGFTPPEISVVKSGDTLSKIGDDVDYTITITNDSTTRTAHKVSINDTLAGDLTDECPATLAPAGQAGDECVITYTLTVPEDASDPWENEVTAIYSSQAAGAGGRATVTDTHSVDLFQPSLTVEKTASPAEVEVGDDVNYEITITNTSSADSPDLVFDLIDDTLAGDLSAECPASLAAGDDCVITYTLEATAVGEMCNTVSVETHPHEFPNVIDGEATACVDVVETPPVLGSITITKEIACEICETFTPGFFFNRGENNAGTAFTNDWLPDNQVTIADENFGDLQFDGATFDSAVQEINAYLNADRSGDLDGEMGLSAQGQLVRQFLALYLNVGFAGEECTLADLVYTGDVVLPAWVDADENGAITVQELLDAAQAATDEAEMRAIAEAIDEINNSGDGDNPVVLDCPEGTEGTTGAGFSFELFGPDDETLLADSGTTDENGVLVLDGDPDGSGLPLGEYLLVETSNDADLECTIVDVIVEGDGSAVLNADGTVTITLTEDAADISITVVNDCEEGEEEEEFGDIEIRKSAADDPEEEFFFSATWENGEFTLFDGDAEFSGDLEAGTSFTVTETLTEAQVEAGWSLEDIDCGEADVDVSEDGMSVTITVVANTTITCTFTNELEEDEENGLLEVDKFWCSTDDETSTEFIVDEPTPMDTVTAQSHEEGEGCPLGGHEATFEIQQVGGTMTWELSTGLDGIGELELPDGDYIITETSTDEDPAPSATFTIMAGHVTVVIVINNEGEDQEEGQLKIIKLLCAGDEASVTFVIEDGDQNAPDLEDCEFSDATLALNGGDPFVVDGTWFESVPVGSYTLTETEPNDGVSPSFDVTVDETTTVIVINTFDEGEQGGGGGPGGNEGTAGGNPVPDTALAPTPTGSVPAALLALLMLSGLGAAGYAVRAEAQRRR